MTRELEEWLEPERLTQGDLFRRETKEFLAKVRIGEADLYRWNQAGWLSDEALHAEELDMATISEIGFVRDIATSGLFTDDIDRLLLQLEKPYRYSPTAIAYSFKYGWVQMPPRLAHDEVDEFMAEHLEKWLLWKSMLDDGPQVLSDVGVALAQGRHGRNLPRSRECEARFRGSKGSPNGMSRDGGHANRQVEGTWIR